MRFCCLGLLVMFLVLGAASLLLADAATSAPVATQPASWFDPARHMRVAEVRPGMTGYGLSVFKGTKIERFDVEVLSILRNFNPKFDVVLIRCKGDYLEHTGSIAGMSGSPIYLHDDQGRDRLIGAFAYGWPMTKDPIAGVQPIEYMLDLPSAASTVAGATQPAEGNDPGGASVGSRTGPRERSTWSMRPIALNWRGSAAVRPDISDQEPAGAARMSGDGRGVPKLQPLTTPMMVSGLSPRVVAAMSPSFESMGITLVQGGGGSSGGAAALPNAHLAPGSVLAVPLLTGDTDMTAVGTCTEVIGDRIWGFGHPFNNEGLISLPMGAGEIQGVVANLQTSFKLGTIAGETGTLTTDGAVGVAGRIGPAPVTIPMDFSVVNSDGSATRAYHFEAARHSKFTPLLAGMAFSSALTGASDLPQFNTVDVDLHIDFTNGQTLHLTDRMANTSANELLTELTVPITAASDNPFEQVLVKKVGGMLRVESVAHSAQLMDITVPKSKYRPGETLKAFATYKPFHAAEATLPLSLELPKDLSAGTYQLVISDAQRYVSDEAQSQPFRFVTENIRDVFGVLRELIAMRNNALYVRLIRQSDGVAIGRTALQKLPTSQRQILLGGGHSDTTPFVSSVVKSIPTQDAMSGSAEFVITIDTSPKIAVGAPRPKAEASSPARSEEPRRASAGNAPEPAPLPH